jgi:hypothetical protein
MEKATKHIAIVPDDTETPLDKIQALSDAIVELKDAVSDLKLRLADEKEELDRLLDAIGMSRLEYDSYRHTGKLPFLLRPSGPLRGKQDCDSEDRSLRVCTDTLLEALGLSRLDGERDCDSIDWNRSEVGRKLNQLITVIERETSSITELVEDS